VKSELLALEEAFWRASGDRGAYEARLADDAVHVFPGWGVGEREPVLEAVAAAAPWDSFEIEDPRVVELAPDAAALVYTAHAVRGGEPYEAAVTSVYCRRDDGWELTLHQQTPL
jgi:predicted GH43/DUF377 family glycosyl hydrolase